MGENINELVIVDKIEEDELTTIVGLVPDKKMDGIGEYTALTLKFTKSRKMPDMWGVAVKVSKDDGLVTLVIRNTSPSEPVKVTPLLVKNDILEFKKLGRVLPPILVQNRKKVLITVDGFWVCLVPNIINTLQKADCQVLVTGPLNLKSLEFLRSTTANQIIPIGTFTALSQEILNSDADTLISLNTPLWQRKIISLMWSHKVNKYLITVNNQWN